MDQLVAGRQTSKGRLFLTPALANEAAGHAFLRYGAALEPWRLRGPNGATANLAAIARLRVDDGDVVHDWALAGLGIMLKSEVDVARDLAAGRLERVLPDWDGGQAPIVALYPSAQYVPLKTSVLLDRLVAHIAAVMNARPEAHPECIDDATCEAVAANRTWAVGARQRALSHLARKAFLAASCRLGKALNLLNPSPTVSQVMGSKNG